MIRCKSFDVSWYTFWYSNMAGTSSINNKSWNLLLNLHFFMAMFSSLLPRHPMAAAVLQKHHATLNGQRQGGDGRYQIEAQRPVLPKRGGRKNQWPRTGALVSELPLWYRLNKTTGNAKNGFFLSPDLRCSLGYVSQPCYPSFYPKKSKWLAFKDPTCQSKAGAHGDDIKLQHSATAQLFGSTSLQAVSERSQGTKAEVCVLPSRCLQFIHWALRIWFPKRSFQPLMSYSLRWIQ